MPSPAVAVTVVPTVPISARARALAQFHEIWPPAIVIMGLALSGVWTSALGYGAIRILGVLLY